MSSILTNTGAMVALQTMKGINANLNKVQSEISTGKSVASAKDNAAVWAISKVMESDVKGFEAISDGLALGNSTVTVARQAAETVTDLLTQIKGKIVAAQGANVDPDKIQADITALTGQIGSVVGAAQFNGLNLVNGGPPASMDVLASLDRAGSSTKASPITVAGHDLGFGDYVANDVFTVTAPGVASANGDTFVLSLNSGGGTGDFTIADGTNAWVAGDKISMQIGTKSVSYTVTSDDVDATNASMTNTVPDMIAIGLKNAIDALGVEGLVVNYDSGTPGQLSFVNDGTTDLTTSGQYTNAGAGGLGALSQINVVSNTTGSLSRIETMLQTAVNAAADLGSSQKRIETQIDFVGKMSDALTTGIGAMVDADMEEASARLQALQTQQQLGIQALSIANQAPQTILSLFR